MVVTLSGIFTDVNWFSANAEEPMISTLSGIFTDVNLFP